MALIHFYTAYQPKDPLTIRRMRVAAETWRTQPWRDRPVTDGEAGRLFTDASGSVPYALDIFNLGVSAASDSDIGIYTNADICVRTDCCAIIASLMQDTHALYCFRRDFRHDFDSPIPDSEIEKGEDYSGSDLYAFRVSWWKKHRDKMPNMLISREGWDAVLRTIMDATNPPGKCICHNLIYHRKHDSVWERPENRTRVPSQKHNIRLVLDFCRRYAINPADWGVQPI